MSLYLILVLPEKFRQNTNSFKIFSVIVSCISQRSHDITEIHDIYVVQVHEYMCVCVVCITRNAIILAHVCHKECQGVPELSGKVKIIDELRV